MKGGKNTTHLYPQKTYLLKLTSENSDSYYKDGKPTLYNKNNNYCFFENRFFRGNTDFISYILKMNVSNQNNMHSANDYIFVNLKNSYEMILLYKQKRNNLFEYIQFRFHFNLNYTFLLFGKWNAHFLKLFNNIVWKFSIGFYCIYSGN